MVALCTLLVILYNLLFLNEIIQSLSPNYNSHNEVHTTKKNKLKFFLVTYGTKIAQAKK